MQTNRGFNGTRLTQLREGYGMSSASLAKLLGIHRNTLRDYENGAVPDGPMLDRLSTILGVPVHFLFTPVLREEHGPPLYRARSKVTDTEKKQAVIHLEWVMELERFFGNRVMLPPPNLPPLQDIPAHPQQITDTHISEVARRIRKHWKLGDAPIHNVVHTLERNGYIIVHVPLGFPRIEALFLKAESGRAFILVNKDYESASRLRNSAMHEAAHDILHGRLEDPLGDDRALMKLMEEQAHKLVLEIFLPDVFLDEVHSVSLETLRILKPRWKVSIQAMLRRLLNADRIDKSRYVSLQTHLSKRGWRIHEPYDDQLPIERPTLLKSAFSALEKKAGVSKSVIGATLTLPTEIVVKLTGLPDDYFAVPEEEIEITPRNTPLFGS